jgi:hypothetical protein
MESGRGHSATILESVLHGFEVVSNIIISPICLHYTLTAGK